MEEDNEEEFPKKFDGVNANLFDHDYRQLRFIIHCLQSGRFDHINCGEFLKRIRIHMIKEDNRYEEFQNGR